jgi:ferredoxin-NADP reductase
MMEKGYSIKTKPIYGTLIWQQMASHHFVVAGGEGGKALLKLFQQMIPKQPTTLFYLAEDLASKKYADILNKMNGEPLTVCDSMDSLFTAIKIALEKCYMGTQFYVAGEERLIWPVTKLFSEAGVDDRNVFKEQCGSLARRVYCVHCETINENVHHDIHQCVTCGLNLLVRDHFSRHWGAYMGFMVDGETPGNIPEVQEIYP